MPTARWRAVFLERFERLHKVSENLTQVITLPAPDARRVRLPPSHDEVGWYRFIHGRSMPDGDEKRRILEAVEESDAYESASETGFDGTLKAAPTGDVLVDSYGFRYKEPNLRSISGLDTVRGVYL